MKIVIGIKNQNEKEINEMFARSPFFQILEIENGKIISETTRENSFSDQTSSAGIAVVEKLAKLSVDGIICLNLGLRALDLAKQLGIRVYQAKEKDYKKIINQFLKNSLTEIE